MRPAPWTVAIAGHRYEYRRLRGAVVTVQITLLGFAIALVLGLGFALTGQSPNRYVSTAMTEIVEFIRSTPLLLPVFSSITLARNSESSCPPSPASACSASTPPPIAPRSTGAG